MVRDDLAAVPLYAPTSLAGVDLDLRDNVNPRGAPPAALRAVRDADSSLLRDYPQASAEALVRALSAFLEVPPSCVAVGCGSDDLLYAALRATASPGDRIAHPEPSFAMTPIFARLNSLIPVPVPLGVGGAADVTALLRTDARVIYVCSPNNPTGGANSTVELLRLADERRGVMILDEAYAEFTERHDLRRAATNRENLLVLRTFSKAWGLAGLRVGYAVGAPPLIAAVTKARGPYMVNALAARAATLALAHDSTWMREGVALTRTHRSTLERALRAGASVRVLPSEGNFVFAAVSDSARVAHEFQQMGIGIRAFRDLPGIGDAIRLGIPPAEQLERVLEAIARVWS